MTTDRLATLLHDEWDHRMGEPSEPGVPCPDCIDSAARLIAAGVGFVDVERASTAALVDKAVNLIANFLWNEDGESDEWLTQAYDILRAAAGAMDARGLWALDARGESVNLMAHVIAAHGLVLDSGCSLCAKAAIAAAYAEETP